ncbi:glutamate racemase [Patescibacteria group bacterium]
MKNRPIGVFDSGLGGLTVVKEIKRILPKESIVYLGDTARVPYGTRSKETIIKFSKEDVSFLLKKKVKCIVIACNSVSSVAADILRKNTDLPIFDVINPTCDYLGHSKKYKKAGIIGTRATIKSDIYRKKINKLNKKVKIFQKEAPLLVPLIEEGQKKQKFTEDILLSYLKDFKKQKVDVVVLACTHYPVLLDLFENILGKKVKLLDPAKFVALKLKKYLDDNNLRSIDIINSSYFFAVTDLTEQFRKQIKIFFGQNLNLKLVKVNLTK